MNKNTKKKLAVIAAALFASQAAMMPFASAAKIGDSLWKAKNTDTPAETQKLIDAKPAMNRPMENLDRGLVAFKSEKSVMLSWRWLGTESADTTYNIYRNGTKLNSAPVSNTMFYDVAPVEGAKYQVTAVYNGTEGEKCAEVSVWDTNSLTVPIQKPEDGKVNGEDYHYSAGDASIGDLDGDGEYEIVLKWDPSNAKDAASSGYTGTCIIDAYKLDGTRLWRIDMGKNIRAGAHDTQMLVFDFDGDGKSEIALRTADGTVDGQGNIIGDGSKNWAVNGNGKNLQGPLYVTVFDGQTGKALDTVDYDPQTGNVSDWGDDYGNRSERYLGTVSYLDGKNPSMVFARGYYTGAGGKGRTVIAAFDFKDGKISKKWTFNTDNIEAEGQYIGQGNHSMATADVDFDGYDEIIYGAIAVDHDGTPMYTTQLGHGDAQHTGDLIPSRPGLEVFSVHEDTNAEYGTEMRDARTGEILFGLDGPHGDVGRGASDDVDPDYPGAESWAAGYMYSSTGEVIAENPSISANFLIYWDGDLGREIQDNVNISKWNSAKNKTEGIFTAKGCTSINSTKANPSLTADMFGDWREETMYPTKDSSALVIYTTDTPTAYKVPTLMHDSQYRTYVATQNVTYNQPAHLGYYLGFDTESVPVPEITVKQNGTEVTNPDLSKKSWKLDELNNSTGVTLAIDQPKAAIEGKIVRVDNDSDDTTPYIAEGDRTLVPLRFISESFGADVEWDDATRQITIVLKDTKIVMTADEKEYTVNGEKKTLDVPAAITNDRTFVPIRAITESLGKSVYWNPIGLISITDKESKLSDDTAKMAYDNLVNAQLPEPVEILPIVPQDKLYENQADVFEVTGSGNDGNIEANAVDGDMDTRWSNAGPSWLQLDLGQETEITGVAIAMWKGTERLFPFSIEVSSDGETWTTALEKTENSGTTEEAEMYTFKTPVKAKYVKYVGDGDNIPDKNYCHISEIVVLKK